MSNHAIAAANATVTTPVRAAHAHMNKLATAAVNAAATNNGPNSGNLYG